MFLATDYPIILVGDVNSMPVRKSEVCTTLQQRQTLEDASERVKRLEELKLSQSIISEIASTLSVNTSKQLSVFDSVLKSIYPER